MRAIHTLTATWHAERMSRRRLQLIDRYEVIGQPVVTSTGLTYVPWIDQAIRPYRATRLPVGTETGLAEAYRRAHVGAGSSAA